MSNKILDALVNAEAGLDVIHQKIKEIQLDSLKTATEVSKILKGGNKNTPNGANKSLQEVTMSMSELNKKVDLYLGLQKDQQRQWKENITSANQFHSNMTAINKQREQTLKLAAKDVAKKKEEARAYNSLNKTFQNLKKEYRDLAIRQKVHNDLTEEEVKRVASLQQRIQRLDKAFKQTDESMGIHTRSVGNYGKAFDSLGFSVAQITRESPAFLNSMQTGFMAISNNIPTLVDEIDKLKIKNAKLVSEQKAAIPIWKSLSAAVLSYQTAVSAGILLLTVAGPALIKWISKITQVAEATDGATAAAKAFNTTLREGAADAESEQQTFETLNKALTSGQLTREQSLKTATKMKKLYPEQLKNMTAEEIVTKGIGKNYEKITEHIARNAAMKAVSTRMTEIANDKLEAQLALEEAQLQATAIRLVMESDIGASWVAVQTKKLWLMGDEADANVKAAEKQSEINKLDKEQIKLGNFINDNIRDFIDLTTESIELEKDNKKNEEDKKEYALFTIAHYKDLISQNNTRIDQQLTMSEGDRAERLHLLELNKYYEKQIKLLGGIKDKKDEGEKYYKGEIGFIQKIIAENNKLILHAKDNTTYERLKKENYQLQEQIDLIKGVQAEWDKMFDSDGDDMDGLEMPDLETVFRKGIKLDDIDEIIEDEDVFSEYVHGFLPMFQRLGSSWGTLTKVLGKDISKLEEEFMIMYEAMGGDPEDTKKMEKEFAKFVAMQESKIEKTLAMIGATVNAAADLGNAIIERNVEKLEQEKTAIEERFDFEMLKAEETMTSKEALADRERFLEEKKAKDLRRIQDQINKEKRKQAIIDKAAAVATIAINTAIGVSAAITKGAVFNSAEVILTLAMGALQTATVLATPIPQYKDGTENHMGGKAIIGDGGKHEAVITPDGSVFKSPKTSTLVDLPSGTVVKSDYNQYVDSMTENQKMTHDSKLIAGLAINAVERKRDNDVLKAIKEQTDVLKKKKMTSSFSNKGGNLDHDLYRLKNLNW